MIAALLYDDPFWVLFLLCLGFALPGLLVGRWVVVAPAAAAMPLYWYALHAGWWGHGVGDGWQGALVVTTVVATVAAAAGVAVRRLFRWS